MSLVGALKYHFHQPQQNLESLLYWQFSYVVAHMIMENLRDFCLSALIYKTTTILIVLL